MEFRWYCRQLDETYITAASGSEDRLYEDGDLIPQQRISQAELQENKDTTPANDFQNGGCFGRGPSELMKWELFLKIQNILILRTNQ